MPGLYQAVAETADTHRQGVLSLRHQLFCMLCPMPCFNWAGSRIPAELQGEVPTESAVWQSACNVEVTAFKCLLSPFPLWSLKCRGAVCASIGFDGKKPKPVFDKGQIGLFYHEFQFVLQFMPIANKKVVVTVTACYKLPLFFLFLISGTNLYRPI